MELDPSTRAGEHFEDVDRAMMPSCAALRPRWVRRHLLRRIPPVSTPRVGSTKCSVRSFKKVHILFSTGVIDE